MMGMLEVLGTAGAVTAAGSFASYAVRGRSSAWFGTSVYHGDRSRPSLALTFDDGPSESTPALLEILEDQQVRATFFMCGRNVRRFPQVAREVRHRGHEIGNHTDTHPHLNFKPPEFIYRELALALRPFICTPARRRSSFAPPTVCAGSGCAGPRNGCN